MAHGVPQERRGASAQDEPQEAGGECDGDVLAEARGQPGLCPVDRQRREWWRYPHGVGSGVGVEFRRPALGGRLTGPMHALRASSRFQVLKR